MSSYPKVEIEPFVYQDSHYVNNGKSYNVEDIIKLAEDLLEFNLPLIELDISVQPWKLTNIAGFVYHAKRILEADYKTYPVILDPTGYICDGWHRVAHAILNGETTIRAKILKVLPEPE